MSCWMLLVRSSPMRCACERWRSLLQPQSQPVMPGCMKLGRNQGAAAPGGCRGGNKNVCFHGVSSGIAEVATVFVWGVLSSHLEHVTSMDLRGSKVDRAKNASWLYHAGSLTRTPGFSLSSHVIAIATKQSTTRVRVNFSPLVPWSSAMFAVTRAIS